MSEITPAELAEWRKNYSGPIGPAKDTLAWVAWAMEMRQAMPRLLDRVEELEAELWEQSAINSRLEAEIERLESLVKEIGEWVDPEKCDWEGYEIVEKIQHILYDFRQNKESTDESPH